MQISIPLQQIKCIDFKTYETYFQESLGNVDASNNTIIFYKKGMKGLEVSFSFNSFIIVMYISYAEINEIYKDQNMNTIDVIAPLEKYEEEHPYLIKFFADYLFNRAIPELSD
jgi:hypothetical protein